MTESARLLELETATTAEARAAFPGLRCALLPVGSTEAHGPHLPLATDVIIARETARRAGLALAARGVGAALLPAVGYAVTEFLAPFAGTISVRAETVGALLDEIAASLFGQGIELLAFVNAHLEPAHGRMLQDAARRITAGGAGIALFPDQRRAPTVGRLGEEFARGGGHAGGYETSLVMAAAPGCVRETLRRGLAPNFADLAERMRAGARDALAAGGPEAYFGDPAAASRDEGERLYDVLATMVADAVLAALPPARAG